MYACARTSEEESEPKALAGWGDWVGAGVKPRKKPSAFERELEAKRAARRANRKPRQDDGLRHVLINEKLNHKADKYMVAGVPHGFGGSKSVYEASIRNPLGPEWSTQAVHKAKIKPAILVRSSNHDHMLSRVFFLEGGVRLSPVEMMRQHSLRLC